MFQGDVRAHTTKWCPRLIQESAHTSFLTLELMHEICRIIFKYKVSWNDPIDGRLISPGTDSLRLYGSSRPVICSLGFRALWMFVSELRRQPASQPPGETSQHTCKTMLSHTRSCERFTCNYGNFQTCKIHHGKENLFTRQEPISRVLHHQPHYYHTHRYPDANTLCRGSIFHFNSPIK